MDIRVRAVAFAARHRWFLGLFAAGAALRVVAMLGYRPALWFPDSYTYVVTAMRPRPDLVRPAGYSMFLRLLEPFHSFAAVVFVQHVLGLLTAGLVYAAVRRWKAWAGAVAAAPVLLDAYQVELETLLVSDTLFLFLVTAATCLALGRTTWRRAVGIGLLLGAATLTRTIGLPLIPLFAVFLFRYARPRPALVMLAAALIPIAGYAGWFHATYHRVGLIGANGVFLYARTMTFADCAVMRPPADLAVLCDPRPPRDRPPSQSYIWDPESPLVRLPGITFTRETDTLAQRFAVLAVTSQPVDYATSFVTELARTFAPGRPVYPDPEVYALYEFPERTPPPPVRYVATVGAQFAEEYERGPIATEVVEPFAGWLRAYQSVAALPGPALLIVLLVPPVAALRGRGHRWGLPWATAWALLAVPAATAEFDYRYVLPAIPLACLAAVRSCQDRRREPDKIDTTAQQDRYSSTDHVNTT
ncbi:glycosyltransferase family 39 protein [Acrocarpospora catenulata]|uniref:glycosyltransferase family 39 protein n=1 Tax=Acrocarpospora catenulata TaxID=2836182 RepID=UPI0027E119B3|nr:glycosyltransferase family 39 protein [Acrocarpospora catenulata]